MVFSKTIVRYIPTLWVRLNSLNQDTDFSINLPFLKGPTEVSDSQIFIQYLSCLCPWTKFR